MKPVNLMSFFVALIAEASAIQTVSPAVMTSGKYRVFAMCSPVEKVYRANKKDGEGGKAPYCRPVLSAVGYEVAASLPGFCYGGITTQAEAVCQ